jgi:hypothetical protein
MYAQCIRNSKVNHEASTREERARYESLLLRSRLPSRQQGLGINEELENPTT